MPAYQITSPLRLSEYVTVFPDTCTKEQVLNYLKQNNVRVEEKVLGWIRFNDRKGPNGEKIMHLEEIQDKRRQEGRKHGYTKPDLSPAEFVDKYLRLDHADVGSTDHPEMRYAYVVNRAGEDAFAWDEGEPIRLLRHAFN